MVRPLLISTLLASLCAAPARADYEVLAEFQRAGRQVVAPLMVAGNGNFHGTAAAGGANDLGTVFRLTPGGDLTILHSFEGADGQSPASGLAEGPDGSLTGAAASGGTEGFGTLFRLTPLGGFSTLISFTGTGGAAPGSVPQGLVRHEDGNYYGVTLAGGVSGAGTVFRLSEAGQLTTLVSFTGTAGAAKGEQPLGPLTISGGILYGVTVLGGTGDLGTVFSVSPAGLLTTLVEFTDAGARPGSQPSGPLWAHTDGNLYGTTLGGGTEDAGTAFRITPAGTFTPLRSFSDATGSQPRGTLAQGADGQLYGVTSGGGAHGFGTAYRLAPSGSHTLLGSFTGTEGAMPGSSPLGGLVSDSAGILHGVTSAGGPGNPGVAFTLTPSGLWTKWTDLSPAQGWMPSGAPVGDGSGGFLFPLARGGSGGGGTLARITPSGSVELAASLGGVAGETPTGPLLPSGVDFYGVCAEGGASGRGTCYRFGTAVSLVSNYTTISGSLPAGPLITGVDGALYGVGSEGGTTGRGTIYRLTAGGNRTRLISFTGMGGAARGTTPQGPLALAGNTAYYGLTATGGAEDSGTLFRMNTAGTLTTLADFSTGAARLPRGGLVAAADGYLYGVLSAGGAGDAGAILRVNPADDTWTTVADFFNDSTGGAPAGPLLSGVSSIYGMTTSGGSGGAGTVFQWSAAFGMEILVNLSGPSGSARGIGEIVEAGRTFTGGLALHPDGTLYGVTPGGGSQGGGVVFRISDRSPLQDWKLLHFGNSDAPDAGDPDQDGIPTLLEYALGTPPQRFSDSPIIPVFDGTSLHLTAPRSLSAPGVTLTLQCSPDLTPESWKPVGTEPDILSSQAGLEMVRYTLLPSSGCLFFRFAASR